MLRRTYVQAQPFIFKNQYYFGIIKQFKLPDLGEKIKEATVKQWHVKEGDYIKEYEPVADVATDKLFTTIPSEYSGRIHKRFHQEEEACLVGQLFLEIEVEADNQTPESGSSHTTAETQQASTTSTTQKSQSSDNSHNTTSSTSNGKLATPAVRALIKEKNLDINKISGTGLDGRILKQDVLNFLSSQNQTTQQKQTETPKKAASLTAPTSSQKPGVLETTVVKMNDYQKGMQKSMTESNTIPHFYLMEEIDITELAEIRQSFKKNTNQNVTFMPFFIKAFSLALNEYPIMNASYDPSKPFQYTLNPSHNISIAVDSPNGLVVPNIKNCQSLNLLEIQTELNRLRDLAQKARIGANDLFNGTICISNVGNICGTYTGPMILPPQVCIVGLGRMQEVPKLKQIEKDGKVKQKLQARKILNASFGCDHRVLDGATVGRFVAKWKSYLENPNQFIFNMR